MTIGIILAGGKGKRFGAEELGKNKTAAALAGKPLVLYGVELFEKTMDKVVVVVGAMAETVREAVGEDRTVFAMQEQPLGTGDAVKVGVKKIVELGFVPNQVVVGYADHMMFYTPEVVKDLVGFTETNQAAVGLLTTEHEDPDKLAWGRIVRSDNGEVEKIVEQKNTNEEERSIREINPGFYCFDFNFLTKSVFNIQPNMVTGEYYITDLVEIAKSQNQKVVAMRVPFEVVGYGINTREELEKDQQMMLQ